MLIIMKKGLFLLPFFLLCAGLAMPQTKDGYRLIWQDEFTEDGTPDAAKWGYEKGFVRNREVQWYQPQNAVCRDGVLVLTARSEQRPNPDYDATSNHWGRQRKNIGVTSASVITKGKFSFLYGRLEVRARIPAARGSWPAIWLLGEGWPWPECGEIDVMEFYERDGVRSILANACWRGEKPADCEWDTEIVPFTHFTAKDSLWATQFHLWRMDWDKDFVRIYLDDELLNEIDLSLTVNGGKPDGFNPFRRSMYLLLNLAMGSSGGKIDEAALPIRYEIDYVRVYQKEDVK